MPKYFSFQCLFAILTASYCAGQTNNEIFVKMAGPAVT